MLKFSSFENSFSKFNLSLISGNYLKTSKTSLTINDDYLLGVDSWSLSKTELFSCFEVEKNLTELFLKNNWFDFGPRWLPSLTWGKLGCWVNILYFYIESINYGLFFICKFAIIL